MKIIFMKIIYWINNKQIQELSTILIEGIKLFSSLFGRLEDTRIYMICISKYISTISSYWRILLSLLFANTLLYYLFSFHVIE